MNRLAVAGAIAGAVLLRRMRSGARPGSPYLAGAPLLIAHRGGAGLAPENTLTAFRRAVEWWRADILELDLRTTRDGEVVVFHDATLERTTDGSGRVRDHSLAEIQALDAGHHHAGFRGQGVRVPTLREVLRELPSVRVNLELKENRGQERLREVIEEAGAQGRVLVAAGRRAHRAPLEGGPWPVSASADELRAFYLAHRLRASRIFVPPVDAFQMPERYGGAQVLSPRFVRDAHARNLAVHVWTVNEESDMRRLLEWGVDGIVTDYPDRLSRLLHELHGRPLPPGPPPGAAPA